MAGNYRFLAAGTLVVASLFYFAALPFAAGFGGGLAVSIFGAAMVGGLADWFAVSALFRKPLGIPWRTAVIPRNRQRLFAVIIHMVQDELLSKENIRRKVAGYDIPRVVLTYISERGGAKTIKRMIHKLLGDVLEKIDPADAGRFIARHLRQEADNIKLAPLIKSIGEWTVETGYDQKIISFVAGELSQIAAKPEFHGLATDFLRAVIVRYEGDRQRRRLFNSIAGISPERMADSAQRQIVALLLAVRQTDHPLKLALRQRFVRYLETLSQPETAVVIECWKERFFSELDLGIVLQKATAWLKQQAAEHPSQTAEWFRQTDRLVDRVLTDFRADQSQQQWLSEAIRQGLANFINAHHDKIGTLVFERLNQFSDDELVGFIESRVGNDLQIIRVNGTIIGGLTGGMLHCLTYWL